MKLTFDKVVVEHDGKAVLLLTAKSHKHTHKLKISRTGEFIDRPPGEQSPIVTRLCYSGRIMEILADPSVQAELAVAMVHEA